MPTYDYKCGSCGHTWERFEPMAADKPRQCPNCRKRKGRRQLGPGAGIILKGPGFHNTDYPKSK